LSRMVTAGTACAVSTICCGAALCRKQRDKTIGLRKVASKVLVEA
jgi:hypothetical protein